MASIGVVASPSTEWRRFGLSSRVDRIWRTTATCWPRLSEVLVRPSDGALILLKEARGEFQLYKFEHPLLSWPLGAESDAYVMGGSGTSRGLIEPANGIIAADPFGDGGMQINTAAACAEAIAVSNVANAWAPDLVGDVLAILPLDEIQDVRDPGIVPDKFRRKHALFYCRPSQGRLLPVSAVLPSGVPLPDEGSPTMRALAFSELAEVTSPYGYNMHVESTPEHSLSSPFHGPEAPILLGEAATLWEHLGGDVGPISRIRYIPSRRGFIYVRASMGIQRPTVYYLDAAGVVHVAGASVSRTSFEDVQDGMLAVDVALSRSVVDVDMHPNGDAYICTCGIKSDCEDGQPRGRLFKVEASSGCMFEVDLSVAVPSMAFMRIAVHPMDGAVFVAVTSPAGGDRDKQLQLLRVAPVAPADYREPLLQIFGIMASFASPCPGGDKWVQLVPQLPAAIIKKIITFVPWPDWKLDLPADDWDEVDIA